MMATTRWKKHIFKTTYEDATEREIYAIDVIMRAQGENGYLKREHFRNGHTIAPFISASPNSQGDAVVDTDVFWRGPIK
jgi:hypothetical protein